MSFAFIKFAFKKDKINYYCSRNFYLYKEFSESIKIFLYVTSLLYLMKFCSLKIKHVLKLKLKFLIPQRNIQHWKKHNLNTHDVPRPIFLLSISRSYNILRVLLPTEYDIVYYVTWFGLILNFYWKMSCYDLGTGKISDMYRRGTQKNFNLVPYRATLFNFTK